MSKQATKVDFWLYLELFESRTQNLMGSSLSRNAPKLYIWWNCPKWFTKYHVNRTHACTDNQNTSSIHSFNLSFHRWQKNSRIHYQSWQNASDIFFKGEVSIFARCNLIVIWQITREWHRVRDRARARVMYRFRVRVSLTFRANFYIHFADGILDI